MEVESTESAIGAVKKPKYNPDETLALPDSIIMYEILPRLPVKSLIRFQSVSRFWFSTISRNPDFAKLHLKYSFLYRRHFFVMNLFHRHLGEIGRYFLLPCQKYSSRKDLEELNHCDSEVHWTELVGCCNGLVCLYKVVWGERERKCYFVLWNPATKQCNKIGSPPGVHIGLAYGFGYVPSLDDYKIVCSFATETKRYDDGDDEGGLFCGFYVFSLRFGGWEKKFGGYDYSSRCRKWKRARNYLNKDQDKEKIVVKLKDEGFWNEGILYWPPGRRFSRNYIVGFDLETEEFCEYTHMTWEQGYDFLELFRLKGCLALHGCARNELSEFWMLKDSDDWGTWQKLFSVDLTSRPRVSFMSLSETGKCLLLQWKHFKLVDLNKEALESAIGFGKCGNRLKGIDHVESLVSPFGMIQCNEEKEDFETAKNQVTDTEDDEDGDD